MAKVKPFRGLRYNPEKLSDVGSAAALPFEASDSADDSRFLEKSEYNISRITSQLGKEGSGNAAEIMRQWAEHNVFIRENVPALYIHTQSFTRDRVTHTVRCVIAEVGIEDYAERIIFPHEHITTSVNHKILDFWNNTGINPCTIRSLYSDSSGEAEALIISQCEKRAPDFEFEDDGITNRLWIAADREFIDAYCGIMESKQLFIAEGHHSYETALRLHGEERGTDGIMMTLTSMENSALDVLPVHRLLRRELFDENTLVNNLTMDFSVSKIYMTDRGYADTITAKLASELHSTAIGLYTGEKYYYFLRLAPHAEEDSRMTDLPGCIKQLDVTALNRLVIEKQIMRRSGSKEPEVQCTVSAEKAIELVKRGEFDCAFIMNPLKLSQLKEAALAGERLPRNSSCFMPKPLSGLVLQQILPDRHN